MMSSYVRLTQEGHSQESIGSVGQLWSARGQPSLSGAALIVGQVNLPGWRALKLVYSLVPHTTLCSPETVPIPGFLTAVERAHACPLRIETPSDSPPPRLRGLAHGRSLGV